VNQELVRRGQCGKKVRDGERLLVSGEGRPEVVEAKSGKANEGLLKAEGLQD
jgi:hypothetical protein